MRARAAEEAGESLRGEREVRAATSRVGTSRAATLLAATALLTTVPTCSPPDADRVSAETPLEAAGSATPPASAAPDAPPPAHPLPAGAPSRFGFGASADEARIARWDLDVRPDGAGLPPGSGSVREGARVWAGKCAACHGPTGTEGPNDKIVGREPREGFPFGANASAGPRTVGNYWPHATTLFDYLTRAMPQNIPGSLTADETYAVVAWILARNEIVAPDAVMDAATLPAVRMPAADRFVPDDRKGGPEVR